MTVLLLPGFGMPGGTLRPLASTLQARGHTVHIAPLGLNVGCGEATVGDVLRLVDEVRADIALVGHSRGGQLALVAAVRRVATVHELVTVGTPWAVGPPDRLGVAQVARVVRAARARGSRVLASVDCDTGECCAAFRRDLGEAPAARWTALWSSTDRVAGADGRPPAAVDAEADLRLGHLGLVTTRRGRAAIADCLAAP